MICPGPTGIILEVQSSGQTFPTGDDVTMSFHTSFMNYWHDIILLIICVLGTGA